MAQHVQPMTLAGTSQNMAFYTERGQTGTGEYIWAEVIRNDYRRRIPSFSVRVHRNMRGQIAGFTYEPKTKPPDGLLAARTLTGLVRAHLAQAARED